MNLAALLFDVARRLPQGPAVTDDRQAWNYSELARRIAGVAGGLRARGLLPGDRVLLCLENCGEFVELMFGCWAAGLCAVPANARLHPREVEYIAGNSRARLLIATPRLDERDTHLLAASVSHGAGLYALPFLLQGAHQIVLPHFDVPAILDVLRHHQRVSLFAAPTMLTRLAHAPEVAGADLANLKTIYYGGGPMYVAHLEKALGLFGTRPYPLVRPGEAPIAIPGLNQRLHANSTHPRWHERLGSCGVARTGVLVRVVDEDDREVPPGEVGEIVTKSDCVMEGYWENPAANAETLRGGWLHTGDLGSMDEDGFLTLRDRSKDIIISGGSNIYPREIEEVLLRHPGLVEAAVVGRPHPDWGEEVVAFVVI